MSRSANDYEPIRETEVLLIAVPESRRTELFQAALARLRLPPAKVIPFTDLLAGKLLLSDYVRPGTIVRVDSPGKDFETERALLRAGAAAEDTEGYARLSHQQIDKLRFDRGRILCPHQWYLGFTKALRLIEDQLSGCPAHYLMNDLFDIALMFDKPRCQRVLMDQEIPTAKSLGTVTSFADLHERMRQSNCTRVFIKLAYCSSASGIIAYQTNGLKHQAITTVEVVSQGNELLLYNSRRVRVHTDVREIVKLVDELCHHKMFVEQWLPKAGIGGKTFDLRIVVIARQARHTVVRLSRHPLTNLHLLGGRGSLEQVLERMEDCAWAEARRTCEQVMTNCFPKSLYAGIDLRIAPGYQRHSVLEVNAFGDLIPEVFYDGLDTYETEICAAQSEFSTRVGA